MPAAFEPHPRSDSRLARRTPGRSASWVLALVCAGQFMVILDASIVNVALPSVQRDLGFSAVGLAWVVNGYLLTFAGLMLLGGRAADLVGQRRMLATGLVVFSASSLVAGLATAPELLVGARVVQGAGAAVLAPATLAVLNTTFTDPLERARAFGAWSAAGGVGGTAGALAGGALTTGLSWRWVFLVNVPIGAVLVALALTSLPARPAGRSQRLDLPGAITGTAGLALVVYGVMQAADHGWTSPLVAGPVGAGLVLLAVFVVVEGLAPEPMVPLRLFTVRAVAVDNLMLLLFGGVAIAMWFFSALLLQNVLGYSALRAGLGQTPAAVMFVLTARRAAALAARTGARPLVLAGSAFLLAGFGWLSRAGADSGYLADVLGPTLLVAVGIGLTFPTLMGAATADAPPGDAGVVGALANTATQVGGSVGLAVLATSAGSAATGSGSGYDVVFLIAAGLALAIALVSLLAPRSG